VARRPCSPPKLGEHRQTWIAPYIKGPVDRPLVVPADRLYLANR
jgi:hypothetical protein